MGAADKPMLPFPQMKGLLGTGATFAADLNLVVQFVMGAALLVGGLLAKQKRYAAHGGCQTTVQLPNLLIIALVMWASFHQQVGPVFPRAFHKRYFTVATIHGALGDGG
jgi:Ca2+/H+ antiporter